MLAAVFLAALWLFARPLALLTLGAAIAAALAPVVHVLQKRMSRILAVVLVYLMIFLIFGGIFGIILPTLVGQAQELLEMAPAWIEDIQSLYENWVGDIPVFETLANQLGEVFSTLLAVPLGLISAGFDIFIVAFISLYTLLEAPKLRRFTLSLFPGGQRERVDEVLQAMAQSMGGFVRGTVIVSILVGAITYIGLLIIGIPFSLVLALLAGVMEFIPYLGPILASIPMLIVALMQSPGHALAVLIFFVILQQLESNIFVPNVMRTQTDISPLLVLIAILIGGSVGGLLGVLVAIPLASALQTFVRLAIAPAVRRQTGAGREVEADEEEAEEAKLGQEERK